MAIDRGPWSALIDDDGSNLVGTVWNKDTIKTVLLDPIDAQITAGTWTPTDASGAGLVFAQVAARYWKLDKFVIVQGGLTYPATANALQAKIGGLPVANGPVTGGLYVSYTGMAVQMMLPAAVATVSLWAPNGAPLTNAAFTGMVLQFSGVYLTA
jgi:hypothetical protein